jgi:transcriptional regulator with XRE-family HTH domain
VTATPPVRRRLVGGALRWHREHLGYTLEDAARVLDCDRSKISRIETGQRGIRRNELRDLLAEYGIGEKQQVILAGMANPRRVQGWYETYADVLPGACQDYVILETWASGISVYEAQRIPALLQTPAYARALAEADPGLADNHARDRAAAATLARQKAILGEPRPDIHVVIGEAALRQEAGGPAVMRDQLEMLARTSGSSAIGAVQILPFTHGAHPAAGIGSLAILQFSASPRLGVAHLGGAGGGILLESQADLAAYDRMFEQLRAFALSPAQSTLLLRELTAR